MEISKSEFVKSAVVEKDYPEFNNTVEFSFIGRSNVGKSSLINSLQKEKIWQELVKRQEEHS